MRAVSQTFLNEQLKAVSQGIKWDIKLKADEEIVDLTSYVISQTLNRIEWRMEDDLTVFKTPDIQFSVWYEQQIWDWIHEHDEIIIEVYCGFPFEMHKVFWGYLDKDNISKTSLGVVYIHAYGYIKNLAGIKTTEVFGDPAVPVYNVALQDVVQTIFNYLGLANQTIKIMPTDSYPDAESYVLSYLQSGVAPSVTGKKYLVRINDHKFYFTDGFFLWMVVFNDDYSHITVTIIEYAWSGDLVRIDKWGDNIFAIVNGVQEVYNYKHGAGWVTQEDWRATAIYFYDANGTQTGSQAISNVVSGGRTYKPMARFICKYDHTNQYVVAYNGMITGTNQIDSMMFKQFNATTHSEISMQYQPDYYFHPYASACTGSWEEGNDFYFSMFGKATGFLTYRWIRLQPNNQITWGDTTEPFAFGWGEDYEAIGNYVCSRESKKAFNVQTNQFVSNFWSQTPNTIGKAVHMIEYGTGLTEQILTGYNTTENQLIIKILDWENNLTTEDVLKILPDDFSIIRGFTYWRTYRDKPCFVGFIWDNQGLANVGILSNQFYPFIKVPPLTENETLESTLQNLALAGCCICYFPDDETGIFISRAYWEEQSISRVASDLFDKEWEVIKEMPRRIVIKTGDMEVTVGEGMHELEISCDYIPDYDENLCKAYAQVYYDFLNNYPYVMEIAGDFLLQYEPYDLVQIESDLGEIYQGRIMQTSQEGMVVGLEIRGKKI